LSHAKNLTTLCKSKFLQNRSFSSVGESRNSTIETTGKLRTIPNWKTHKVNTPFHLPVQQHIIGTMSYQSVNPYNGKILKEFKLLTDKQLEAALKTATTCYDTWKRKTYAVLINVEANLGKPAPATP
jgi:hypothetical protein